MTKDRRTTPKVIVSRVVLNSLAVDVIDATNATDIAPLIPPSMTTCLHITGIFSLVTLYSGVKKLQPLGIRVASIEPVFFKTNSDIKESSTRNKSPVLGRQRCSD